MGWAEAGAATVASPAAMTTAEASPAPILARVRFMRFLLGIDYRRIVTQFG
ncbi:hypothetical protein GCM10009779_36660 [Polymorphospora rubra]|uniref:Uncharacterized protein n=1 Tax=Polymorphospora rubra TaxID=338584 RepID=A0A810NE63_9ACTN|nr:hypothetical protein Prubr_71990 [Polymorphospora rubra]